MVGLLIASLGCGLIAHLSTDLRILIFWIKLLITFLIAYFPVSVHFCIRLSGTQPPRILYFIYGAGIPLLVVNWHSLFFMNRFVHDGIWLMSPNTESPWFYIFITFMAVSTSISLTALTRWWRRTPLFRERRQARILTLTLAVTSILALLESAILPAVTPYRSRGFGVCLISIWLLGVFYSLIRYRLLQMSPDLLCRDLIDNVTDAILLIKPGQEIEWVNRSTLTLLKRPAASVLGRKISRFICDWKAIESAIRELYAGRSRSFSCTLALKTAGNPGMRLEGRFSLVSDRFGDPLGTLVICRVTRDTIRLQELYRLTAREIEVVQCIASGYANADIAVELAITVRTVKAHLASIYGKLGVERKPQLLVKLSDYNLMPRFAAEKKIVLFPSQ
jgi:DNA-binding CsgD family transcriptional regulator